MSTGCKLLGAMPTWKQASSRRRDVLTPACRPNSSAFSGRATHRLTATGLFCDLRKVAWANTSRVRPVANEGPVILVRADVGCVEKLTDVDGGRRQLTLKCIFQCKRLRETCTGGQRVPGLTHFFREKFALLSKCDRRSVGSAICRGFFVEDPHFRADIFKYHFALFAMRPGTVARIRKPASASVLVLRAAPHLFTLHDTAGTFRTWKINKRSQS